MRILSFSPSSTEILYAIGAEANIIGVSSACDFPESVHRKDRYASWVLHDDRYMNALRPDIVISTERIPHDVFAGQPNVTFLYEHPRSLAEMYEHVHDLGWVTGNTERARTLIGTMQREEEVIRAAAPQHQLHVYCEAQANPPTHAGKWVPEIVALAGGKQICATHGQPHSNVHVDALHAENPDLVIVAWDHSGPSPVRDVLAERPGWDTLRAVQHNACVAVPSALLLRPGPRLLEGARRIQHALVSHHHMR